MCCAPGALDVQEEEIMFPLKRRELRNSMS